MQMPPQHFSVAVPQHWLPSPIPQAKESDGQQTSASSLHWLLPQHPRVPQHL
jgi:hypothetical protein